MDGFELALERSAAFEAEGLRIEASADPADPLLDTFFAAYDRAFVLPDEKEELSGFHDCLALNLPPRYGPLAERYGPFRELVMVARDGAGTMVGGANFICFPLAGAAALLSMNLNYLFVLPEHRGRGHLRRLLAACRSLARWAFRRRDEGTGEPDILLFLELNDPLRLDPAAYARDSAHAGVDQVERIRIWNRVGARLLDLPYVQPPLSATQEAERNLLLALIGAQGQDRLDAGLLARHLLRFFSISVLKGRDAASDPDARAQLQLLDEVRTVRLLDPAPWLAGAGPRAAAGGGLREVLKAMPPD